jgi:hypothetical protein
MSIEETPEGTESYEPPEVEQMPAEDGPAVTAAGKSPEPDEPIGPEWRPEE